MRFRGRRRLPSSSRLALSCFLVGALSSNVARAKAPEAADPGPPPLEWRGTPYHPAEAVATLAAGVGTLVVMYGVSARVEPGTSGGILFDDAIRDGLRLRSPGARDASRTLSDVTVLVSVGLALGVDSLVIPLVRGRPGVALRMVLVDLEAIALNGFLTQSSFKVVGRARPSYEECKVASAFDPLCDRGSYSGFWSGHAAQAFTAAGLSCAHHAYLHLLGGGAPDALACVGMLTLAATTGTLRLVGDRHYATDIIVGSLVGFGIGYGVPTLVHYYPFRHAQAVSSLSLRPFATAGLSVEATF